MCVVLNENTYNEHLYVSRRLKVCETKVTDIRLYVIVFSFTPLTVTETHTQLSNREGHATVTATAL